MTYDYCYAVQSEMVNEYVFRPRWFEDGSENVGQRPLYAKTLNARDISDEAGRKLYFEL